MFLTAVDEETRRVGNMLTITASCRHQASNVTYLFIYLFMTFDC